MIDYFMNFMNLTEIKKSIIKYIPDEIKSRRSKFLWSEKCYVYYDLSTILSIIGRDDNYKNVKHTLWFKNVSEFEDYFEKKGWKSKFFNWFLCVEYFDNNKEAFPIEIRNLDFLRAVNNVLQNYNFDNFKNKYYILCTSYKSDNNTCWTTFGTSYAKNLEEVKVVMNDNSTIDKVDEKNYIFKGNIDLYYKSKAACICFDANNLELCLNSYIFKGYIRYGRNEVFKFFNEQLIMLYEKYRSKYDSKAFIDCVEYCIDLVNLFFKDDFYSGEKELRFIIEKTNIENDELFEKIENIDAYSYPFNFDLISHITLYDREDYKFFSFLEKNKIRLSKKCLNRDGEPFFEENSGIPALLYED